VYNDLEILTEIWYNYDTEPAYEHKYTSDCKLAMIIDNIYGTITAYKYGIYSTLSSASALTTWGEFWEWIRK
jgi:hypothetical protein